MYDLKDFFAVLDGIAPIKYSYALIEKGDYDNSGIIVAQSSEVKRVLFSLDLSVGAVKQAKKIKCDTIVTHHPAIYHPVKTLDGENAALLSAVNGGLNVISMHLNLDVAKGGVDESLAAGLGGENAEILDRLEDGAGYGRKFYLGKSVAEIKKTIKNVLRTDRTLFYGDKGKSVGYAASFCGGGAGYAEDMLIKGKLDGVDAVITSDVPHHIIKRFYEAGKALFIVTHYAAENYGFGEFYERVKNEVSEKIEISYYEDKKLM